MKGKIKRFNPFAPGNPLGPKKRRKRGGKKKTHSGSTFRDYRGVEGVLEDGHKSKLCKLPLKSLLRKSLKT